MGPHICCLQKTYSWKVLSSSSCVHFQIANMVCQKWESRTQIQSQIKSSIKLNIEFCFTFSYLDYVDGTYLSDWKYWISNKYCLYTWWHKYVSFINLILVKWQLDIFYLWNFLREYFPLYSCFVAWIAYLFKKTPFRAVCVLSLRSRWLIQLYIILKIVNRNLYN